MYTQSYYGDYLSGKLLDLMIHKWDIRSAKKNL